MNLGRYAPKRWRLFRFRALDDEPITPLSVPERLRLAFEELGPTFIKLAQMLSTRTDLIAAIVGQEEAIEWIREFKKLQSHAPPFPFEDVRRIVESDLRCPLERIFANFDPTPVAAASIAQVHRATLHSGESVVVKVQRPNIAGVIRTDLNLLKGLAKRLEKYVVESRLYKPTELVGEFSRSIQREIDFTMEGANTDYFHRSFLDNKNVKIPKVYWEYTNQRVLTMEQIDGIPIDAVEQIEAAKLERAQIADALVDFFYRQIFVDGFFHSDPHPGNLFVLEDGRIGLVDFGMVGRISGEMLNNVCGWFVAILNRDVDRVVKTYVRMGLLGDTTSAAALKMEMADFLDRYFNMPLSRIRIGALLDEVVNASLRHQIQFPSAFLMLGKTVITIEAVVMSLNPDFDLVAFSQPYITKIVLQQFEPQRWMKQVYGTVEDFTDMATDLPLQLHQILQKLQRGNLKLEIDQPNQERLISVFDRVSNRVSFSLIIASLIIGSSILLQGVTSWGLKSMLGVMGYVAAGVFGIGLIISILRSGRLW
jgi:ubiquinone biosynthesis protein